LRVNERRVWQKRYPDRDAAVDAMPAVVDTIMRHGV
jgi:hypothetical protein